MGKEIERRWLLETRPPTRPIRRILIRQGYFGSKDKKVWARVRETTDQNNQKKYFLTLKSGVGLTREEDEREIDSKLFDFLWQILVVHWLGKIRLFYPLEGTAVAEVNFYKEVNFYEKHSGSCRRIKVEVEFQNEEAARAFVPPDWLGREVTDDPRYLDLNLALYGWPEENL